MINISDAMKNYLSDTTRVEGQYVRAEITTKSGNFYTISDDEFSGGSIKLTKKSVSSSSFDIGECYINNITLTIIDKSDKYSESFDNAEMSVFFGVVNDKLSINEEFQIGKFIIPVDTTIRKIASIQLTGDSMLSKLDMSTNGITTSGTPYNLVLWCCDSCGVEFALTEDEFNALSNNTKYTFYVSSDSSISTFRDVIMYISQIIGGFATDTNDGKLTFKNYKSDNDKFSINNDTIASSKLGDTSYKLEGLSINHNSNIIYINGDSSSDYLLELDSNPLLDSLTEDLVTVIATNIWNQVKDLVFRSFEFEYNGNPALECSDIMYNNIRDVTSYITSLSWTYHGKSSINGAVLDKRTKTQSQSIKKASTTGGGSSNDMKIIRYINSESYKLSSAYKKILQMYFVLPSGVSPIVSFSMNSKTDLLGLLTLSLYYDGIEQLFKPKNTCQKGYNMLSFTKSFDSSDVEMLHSLSILAKFDIDESEESINNNFFIDVYDIESNVLAYKAESGTPEFTGRYELEDNIGIIRVSSSDILINPIVITSNTELG